MRQSATVPRWLAIVAVAGCGRFGFSADSVVIDAPSDSVPDVAIDAPLPPNRIFMSSTTHDGAFGGLTGIDAFCQALADGQTLGGAWQAVVWANSQPPSARFAGSRGWVNLAGTVIADLPTDLDAATLNPLRFDESGQALTDTASDYAFYGGMPPASDTCVDWTSNTMSMHGIHVVHSEASFDTDVYSDCPSPEHVVCAEIGRISPTRPPIETGRIAFITAGMWVPSGGLSGADMFCQSEANAAGVTGTFLAYLPTAAATADSRFTTTGLPWRRVDGVRIVDAASDLVGASPLPVWKSFIGRTAAGVETKARVWTGTQSQSCSDWAGGSSALGSEGESQSAWRLRLQLFANVGCASALPLICLQQ